MSDYKPLLLLLALNDAVGTVTLKVVRTEKDGSLYLLSANKRITHVSPKAVEMMPTETMVEMIVPRLMA